MFNQTFALIDIPKLLTLTLLEGTLSVDNALALAIIIQTLPLAQKKKALFYGFISALVLRACGVLLAAYLIYLYWIQLLGGIYLIYLAFSHFFWKKKRRKEGQKKGVHTFWKAVILVELTDCVFAIDSILAGIALIGVHFTPPELPPKIWIVYFGGVVGIFFMRFAAKFLSSLLNRFPGLEKGAHLIVAWIGAKLILEASLKGLNASYEGLPLAVQIIFWVGILFFFILGFFLKNKGAIAKE